MTTIYTDGSGNAKGGDTGCGVVLINGHWRVEAAYAAGWGTHNTAELRAIMLGLRMLAPKKPIIEIVERPLPPLFEGMPLGLGVGQSVTLYSDSEYAMYSTTGRYDGKKNRDLIELCRKEAKKFPDLEFIHVPGHSNHKWNDRADLLAGDAARKARELKVGKKQQGFVRLDVYLNGNLEADLQWPKGMRGAWVLRAPTLSSG